MRCVFEHGGFGWPGSLGLDEEMVACHGHPFSNLMVFLANQVCVGLRGVSTHSKSVVVCSWCLSHHP